MLWRFLQISDPHLGSESVGRWNNGFICTMMPDVMRCMKGDIAKLNPEFILATGDLASFKSRDAIYASRDLMDSLGYPYYPMGGNHDFVVEESREWFMDAFHAHLPERATNYTIEHKGIRFIVLDAWWLWSDDTVSPFSESEIADRQQVDLVGARWVIPDAQLEWLKNELSKKQDMPTLVVCHYPAMGIPERLQRPNLQDGGHLQNGAALQELLAQFSQVKAYISGHLHMHIIEKVGDITHIVTGSLPEYPTEYRDFHVYEDRIEVHTLGLSDPSFAARSLIPGNGFTAGHPCDRVATIPLV
jgi:DNA repair exonuclease SbcCD nuclease subunit